MPTFHSGPRRFVSGGPTTTAAFRLSLTAAQTAGAGAHRSHQAGAGFIPSGVAVTWLQQPKKELFLPLTFWDTISIPEPGGRTLPSFPNMDVFTFSTRVRSDSTSSSTASQGSRSKMLLRQRLNQLMTCVEDMSSDDEAGEEVCRSLDEAFQLCGRFHPTDTFRLTRAHFLSSHLVSH